MSPYVDSERIAESEQTFRDGLASLRETYSTMDRDVLLAVTHLRMMAELTPDQIAQVAVIASVLLVEEEAVSAKTLDNWDIMSEQRAEQESERNRIAWTSARQRAAGHLAALVEADRERDYLRQRLQERDDEVAALVVRLAAYSGITS